MRIDLFCSYGHFEKILLLAQKTWINPNLDLNNFFMCIFWISNLRFLRSPWYIMFNGLCTNPWISMQCLNFVRFFFLMCCYMFDFLNSSNKVSCGSNYGICGRWKNFLNLDIHKNKITYSTLWAFGFGGVYVYTTILYCWYFSLW